MTIEQELKGKTYTVPEIAELLEMSRTAVYTAIREGTLQAYQCGRTYKVTEKQLRAYLERKN